MNPLDKVDSSWYSILSYAKQGKLEELNTKILPNISYQPKPENIFRALSQPISAIKVVILGQDPYPISGKAIGYSFAVPLNQTKPKSLQIIEKEILQSDHLNVASEGVNMLSWPDQGVLLLNTALTVETGKAGSHLKYWEDFTIKVIQFLSNTKPCIWLLWGKHAIKFASHIKRWQHEVRGYDRDTIEEIPINLDWNYILTSAHPITEVYESGKFYGEDHFYFVNRILALQGKTPIIW